MKNEKQTCCGDGKKGREKGRAGESCQIDPRREVGDSSKGVGGSVGEGEKEVWRPVVGLEGRYQVSNLARIRSFRFAKDGSVIFKVRKPQNDERGYGIFHFKDGVKSKSMNVHSVVAAAFLGPRKIGQHVNHKDGDKWNSRLSNLEYVSPSENTKHAYDNGLIVHKKGMEWHRTKLTDEQVLEIRNLCSRGMLQKHVAKIFGVSNSYVCCLVHMKFRLQDKI